MDAPEPSYENELFAAVGAGELEDVRTLLAAGVDVRATDQFGSTALHLAVNGLFPPDEADPIVQALLAAGAEVNARSTADHVAGTGGCTPLMEAAHEGHLSQVRTLLAAGADVNIVSAGGWSALMFATQAGVDIAPKVDALLAAGADPTLRDRSRTTALDRARSHLAHVTEPNYAQDMAELQAEITEDAKKLVVDLVGTDGSDLPEEYSDAFAALAETGADTAAIVADARDAVRLLEGATRRGCRLW